MSNVDDILFAPVGGKTDIVLPSSWIDIIGAIRNQDGWESSSLAGGALRDLDNGRSVKDVDIFVPFFSNQHTFTKLKQVAFLHNSGKIVEVAHSTHNNSQLGKEGINHYHFDIDGWKFEISQKTERFDYQSLLDSFDIGLCMISLDPKNLIYRTPEYKHDVTNQKITVVRETGGREIDHAQRIQRKYSAWTIVPL